MKKLIRAALLALLGSLLSAFYLSMVQAADIVPDEIKLAAPSRVKSVILHSQTNVTTVTPVTTT